MHIVRALLLVSAVGGLFLLAPPVAWLQRLWHWVEGWLGVADLRDDWADGLKDFSDKHQ